MWVIAAGAVPQPGDLDDEVDGRGDLLADGAQRQVHAGHQHHRLQPRRWRRAGSWRAPWRASRRGRCSSPAACPAPRRRGPRRRRSGRAACAASCAPGRGCVISPLPSMFGGRLSSRTTCSCWSCSSAASSMVTMRSSSGMKEESTLSSVVLPVPVPPETMMFSLASHAGVAGARPSPASACRSSIRSSTCERVSAELADGERRAVDGQRRDDRVDAGAVRQAARRPAARTRRCAGRPARRSAR